MATRIIMNQDILTPLKKFINGQVYDSRVPLDYPVAADGIQHSIQHSIRQHLLDRFIEEGWAREQEWDRHPLMSQRSVQSGMSCQIIVEEMP